MKSISIKISLCACVLLWAPACSEKHESKSTVEPKLAPAKSELSPVSEQHTVDLPVLNVEPSPVKAELTLKPKFAAAADTQVQDLVLEFPAGTPNVVSLQNAVEIPLSDRPQLVQSPGLRSEARAQAMKEMRLERSQQK